MTQNDSAPRVYTPAMLAERWQCSERHVHNLIATGVLPSFRLGAKLVRIRTEDVDAFERQPCSPRSSSNVTGTVVDVRSDPVARARLSGLRRRSTRT